MRKKQKIPKTKRIEKRKLEILKEIIELQKGKRRVIRKGVDKEKEGTDEVVRLA